MFILGVRAYESFTCHISVNTAKDLNLQIGSLAGVPNVKSSPNEFIQKKKNFLNFPNKFIINFGLSFRLRNNLKTKS